MKRALLFTGLMLLAPASAWAQGTGATGTGSTGTGANGASSKSDQAGATALFYEARNLMQKGNFKDACPKLEESLRLDYGIGTEFNLADCYEHVGKTASAWSGFLNVASQAKAQNQAQREKVARDRAKALEPKLPKMVIEVPAPPSGVEVKRDGVIVGQAAWGTAVPVDPGSHKVVVTAPGKQAWETSVSATESTTTRVTVPRDLPNAPVAAVTPAAKPPVAVVPPPTESRTTTTTTVSEPPPSSAATDFPQPVVERGNTQRTLGWVTTGAGIVGLGVGAGFGLNSMAKRRDSNEHCEGNLCDQAGVNLRDDAIRSGNVSTIATIAGGVALVGGIILIVTAPSSERQPTTSARSSSPAKSSFSAVPSVARGGGGLMLQGVFQ